MPFTYVEDEVPEELSTSTGFTFPGQLIELGFVNTPQFKMDAAARGSYTVQPRMFVYGINPLSFGYDRNPQSWQYEQEENHRRAWMNYLDKRGGPISANSPFGVVKAGFAALGYKIRNAEDCKKLIGKNFMFRVEEKKFAGEDSKPQQIDVPVQELPADYKWSGERVIRRLHYDTAPTVSAQQESADAEKLIAALNGKAPNEFIMALASNGLNAYIDEAADGQALVTRMTRLGMKVEDGRLVSA